MNLAQILFKDDGIKIIIFFIFLVLISSKHLYASEESLWQVEEVFTQLSELRRDNQSLRKELNEQKKEVSDLKQNNNQGKLTLTDAKKVLGKAPSLGKKDAEVVVIEFTDFQCPYCKKHEMKTFAKLKESYMDTGKVLYAVKDYPLSFHGQAKPAAVAANCAGEQENYWTMRHKIFENQRNLGQAQFKQFANELKLDQQVFSDCLDNPQQTKEVEQAIAYADQIGIRSTPSFVIARRNRDRLEDIKIVTGAQSYKNFSRVLDTMIATEAR